MDITYKKEDENVLNFYDWKDIDITIDIKKILDDLGFKTKISLPENKIEEKLNAIIEGINKLLENESNTIEQLDSL